MDYSVVRTDGAPAPVGPYSQAVVAGDTVYCSGQLAIDPVTGTLNTGDIQAQATQIMKNMAAVLKEAGSSLAKVVKVTIFFTNLDNFAAVNEVYGSFFEGKYPARSAIQVSRLPLNAEIEIECIALR